VPQPRRCVRRAAFVLALVAGAGAASAPGGVAGAATPAPPSPIFGLRPALAGVTSLSQGHFSYAMPAGATIEDGVDVVNFTPGPLNINMYRANLEPVRGGGLAPGQAEDAPSGATPWLQLQQADVVLSPNGYFRDPFRLSIPSGTPPGQYLTAIVGSRTGAPVGGGLVLQSRVALEVEVTVVGSLRSGLSVGKIQAHRSGQAEQLTVEVTNTGNTLVTLGGAVTVHPWGGGAVSVPLGPQSIYVIPGGTAILTGTWSGLPLVGPADLEASVTVYVDGARSGTHTSPTLALLFIPWLMFSGAAGGLLVVVVGFVLTRRRRVAWRARRAEERWVIRQYRAGHVAKLEPSRKR
jgi:hypothetical protein